MKTSPKLRYVHCRDQCREAQLDQSIDILIIHQFELKMSYGGYQQGGMGGQGGNGEMADYAVSTINGAEIHGRKLRVDRSR
uniref:Uncharacterized protein n=1 Tax=Romanomermis culicivorax TaxID=13658 RepID=A0A915L126_ROMCU